MTGIVRNQTTGTAVVNAQIEIVQGVNLGRVAPTNASGAYSMERLTGGAMRVQVTATDYASQSIDVPLSGNLTLNFELIPLPVYIYSGIVTDSLGNPVAGVIVRGGPSSAETDANGRYEFRSNFSSVPGSLRPPAGYERKPIDPLATFVLVPGQNLTVRRITTVSISPPPTVTEGAGRVTVNARITFDSGQIEPPYADSFTMTSTDTTVLRAGSGGGLGPPYIEGLKPGAASVNGSYFGVSSSTYQVQVLPR